MDILAYSAVELAGAIKAGETTAVEAMQAVLDESVTWTRQSMPM